MNKLDLDYQNLLKDILENGVKKETRNGTTISVFGRQIRHNMKDGFPLLTTKKMPFKTIVTELLWFLRGDTNIKYLVDNGCNIWNGDAYKNYLKNFEPEKFPNYVDVNPQSLLPLSMEDFIDEIKTDDEFAKKWGELGPIYGKQWRKWRNKISANGEYMPFGNNIDQIQNLINDLKTNPDSRRLMVNAWNCSELDQMVLPPCHYGFQVYTRELSLEERTKIWDSIYLKNVKPEDSMDNLDLDGDRIPTRAISLMWNQRSVDTFLGLPFNIASYGLLLEIIAKEVNMVPEELIGNLGDVHLYSNHLDAAKEQIGREMTLWERTNYGIDVLGYNGLLDYGHSQNDDDKILEFLEMCGDVPTRTREPFPLPTLKNLPNYRCMEPNWKCYEIEDIRIDNYESHPTIKAPLSN